MKPTRPRNFATAIFATALLACTLTACSSDEPERPPTNTVEEVDEAPATPSPTPSPDLSPGLAPPDAAIQSNAMDELSDEVVAPDAQMMDDASASGMTARASRVDPASQETPVADIEQK